MEFKQFLNHFQGVVKAGSGYNVLCPCHDDKFPSLSISQGHEGRIVLHCQAGCKTADILNSSGLNMKDLFPGNTPKNFDVQRPKTIEKRSAYMDFDFNDYSKLPCSLDNYASMKRLASDCLTSFHVKNKGIKIEIPYLNESGQQTAIRYRTSLCGKDKFRWNKGAKLSLYGLWRISEYNNESIFLVEGESDSHTLWSNGLQALGIPGANNWKEDRDAPVLNRFDTVCVIIESDRQGKPDAGGKAILNWLKDSSISQKVRMVTLPTNDASELYVNDPDSFKEIFENCLEQAVSFHDYNKNNTFNVEWEKPVSLKKTTALELKPDLLPGILGEITSAVSLTTETPLELATGLMLSVFATACQGKFIVQVKPGYTEPVNIWVIVALDPANRKSSVHGKMTKPLSVWERFKLKELEPIIMEMNSILQNQQSRIKSLRIKYGKAEPNELKAIESEILEIENNLVNVPNHPQVWSQDVTTERLGSLMAEHNEKMSILSAEGGIFDIIGGRYSNGIPNLDLYLQGHSGDPVKVDRGSRDSVYLDSPALSLGLSPQPEVLRGLADKSGFRGKGLLARFLYLLPNTNLGYRKLESEPVSKDVEDEYCDLVCLLLDIEQPEDDQGKKIPYVLKLSNEAYQKWLEFARVVEKDLREGGRFEYITDWAGKLPGAAARIAGLLHCDKKPYQPWAENISLETMQIALELASIFSSHALIAFDMMGADKAVEQARKIWRWIERNGQKSFTKRDCFNALKGTFHRVLNMEDPIKVLIERNHIKEIPREKKVGKPSIKYAVNPELLFEGI